MKQWYEKLFENFAVKYDNEVFTQGTIGECDFIEKEINYDKTTHILDLGCGTGRHTIELTKRGYNVMGVDLSSAQLAKAREKALIEDLNIEFRQLDARHLDFNSEFDLVIMLCEGGFSLMETDEMNEEILINATKALKPQGKIIFTTLNGLFPIFNSINDFQNENANIESSKLETNFFDIMTFRQHSKLKFIDDDGNKFEIDSNERFYIPSEITWMLKKLDYKNINIYGSKLGAYSREDKLTVNDFEMLIIAEK